MGDAKQAFRPYRWLDVFSDAAATLPDSVAYQGREDMRFAIAEYTTASYLDVVGYRVTAGRWFTGAEDRARPACVLA